MNELDKNINMEKSINPIPMQLSDIMDRMSILQLKEERLGEITIEGADYREYYHRYTSSLDIVMSSRLDWLLTELYTVNGKIWNLEADIRQGKEGLLGLEEVGRRALLIRDYNAQRIQLKNHVTELIGEKYKEIKIDHASE